MERQATYDDVNLILKLYEMRREPRMREARAWFVKNLHASSLPELEKLCPPGSEENASFRMVLTYWDMVAGFITSGVLHPELFFQSGNELLLCWARARDIVLLWREALKNPKVCKNLETVASQFADWLNRGAPDAYQTLATRMRAR